MSKKKPDLDFDAFPVRGATDAETVAANRVSRMLNSFADKLFKTVPQASGVALTIPVFRSADEVEAQYTKARGIVTEFGSWSFIIYRHPPIDVLVEKGLCPAPTEDDIESHRFADMVVTGAMRDSIAVLDASAEEHVKALVPPSTFCVADEWKEKTPAIIPPQYWSLSSRDESRRKGPEAVRVPGSDTEQ